MIREPGFFPDMGEADYFADPAPLPSLRQSGIKTLNSKSPHHFAFEHARLNPYRDRNRRSTRFMRVGSAVHSLALGRGKPVSVIRHRDYKSSTARRAADLAVDNGRIPVLEHEYERSEVLAAIVRRNLDDYFEGAEWFGEVPFFWIEPTPFGDVWAAGMLDAFCPSKAKAADVKISSIPATKDAVGRDMAANGYDGQNAWYRRGVANLSGGSIDFATIYHEDQAPHGSSAFELDEPSLYTADLECQRAAWRFAECLRDRSWPSYPRRQIVSTPAWHQTAALARQLSEESA